MKTLLISICLLSFSYGCSPDEVKISLEPTLNTAFHNIADTLPIKDEVRWDGTNFEYVESDTLQIVRMWRFISYLKEDDGSVRIKGGQRITLTNPSDKDVRFVLGKVIFTDEDDIPLAEADVSSDWEVSANSTAIYVHAFKINVDNIDIANQITTDMIWASVNIK